MAVKKEAKNAPQQEIKLDPAVAAYMSNGHQAAADAQREKEVNLTAAQRRKRKFDRARTKATYDLPLEIKEKLRNIADTESVPVSHLVALFLHEAVRRYDAGEYDVTEYKEHSRHPAFEFALALPATDPSE